MANTKCTDEPNRMASQEYKKSMLTTGMSALNTGMSAVNTGMCALTSLLPGTSEHPRDHHRRDSKEIRRLQLLQKEEHLSSDADAIQHKESVKKKRDSKRNSVNSVKSLNVVPTPSNGGHSLQQTSLLPGTSEHHRRRDSKEIREIISQCDGSFQDLLAVELHSACDLLSQGHEKVISMTAKHMEVVKSMMTETGRLRLENQMLRSQQAGSLYPSESRQCGSSDDDSFKHPGGRLQIQQQSRSHAHPGLSSSPQPPRAAPPFAPPEPEMVQTSLTPEELPGGVPAPSTGGHSQQTSTKDPMYSSHNSCQSEVSVFESVDESVAEAAKEELVTTLTEPSEGEASDLETQENCPSAEAPEKLEEIPQPPDSPHMLKTREGDAQGDDQDSLIDFGEEDGDSDELNQEIFDMDKRRMSRERKAHQSERGSLLCATLLSTPLQQRSVNFKDSTEDGRLSHTSDDEDYFEVLPVWKRKETLGKGLTGLNKRRRQGISAGATTKRTSSLGAHMLTKTMEDAFEHGNAADRVSYADPIRRRISWCCGLWIMHPHSARRALWDLLSLMFVSYDMFMIPLQMFEPPETRFLDGMEWVTRIFWSVDMLASFMTGYILNDGAIEMNPCYIAKRYVMTWFGLDLLIVGVDWLEVAWGASSRTAGYARLGKASRVFRILRMLRLLRLLRIAQVVKFMSERILSELIVIIFDIVKIMMIILGMAHLIACAWYGIGLQSYEVSPSWIELNPNFRQEPFLYRYTTCMHWSLSQFTGGMDEVRPANTGERVYAIAAFLFAFIVSAVFISSITSSMTQLHIIGSQQAQNLSILRRFLGQNAISNRVAMRVQRNAQHALVERQRFLPESSIELLQFISEPLRVELHFEMYGPSLSLHPFFQAYAEECPQVVRKVCHMAVSTSQVSRGDVVFTLGEIPAKPRMYIVCTGDLEYTKVSGLKIHITHEEEQWLSEATLWTQWMHRGELKAQSNCRLVMMAADKFQDIVGCFDHLDFDPRKYAAQYVHHLNYYMDTVSDLPTGEESIMTKNLPRSTKHHEDAHGAIDKVRRSFARALSRANSHDSLFDGSMEEDADKG